MMMASIVDLVDFAAYLRTSFDDEDAYTAQQLLDDATAIILDEVGQPLAQSTDTVRIDGSGTTSLLLPRWPVNDVTSVTVTKRDGTTEDLVQGEGEDYTWKTEGILTRLDGIWPCGDRNVLVVYNPGYATISNDIKRICRRLAAAGWYNPAAADSEDSGDHRVRWHTPGAELTTAEKNTLAKYKAH